jgi:polysaccharide chain length determinant protein (PEP-CTERM system associated)
MLPGRKYTPEDIIRLVWARRWFLVVPVVVCSFAGLIVSAMLPDVFESDMLIQIVPQRVPDSYVRSTVTMRTEDRLSAVSSQVMSRTQLEAMVLEFDIYRDERAKLPMEDVVETMRGNIAIELVRSSGSREQNQVDAFHLKFKYGDPEVATRVTQRLGTLYIDYNARDRGALAQATNQFLETQLVEARARLEAQERKLEQFREAHAGRLPSQLDFNMQAIQSAQMQVQAVVESLARDRDRKLMLERLYNDALAEPVAVAAAPAPANTQTPEPAATGTARQQLELARTTLARLELRLKPEHPDVLRTKRMIADLEARVEEEAKSASAATAGAAPTPAPALTQAEQTRRERLTQMRAEIESLDRQIAFKESEEQRVRAKVAEYQQRVEAVPGTESEWMALSRDYETLQTAYRGLLSKSEESKVAADLERRQIGEQFRILDPARTPVRPVSPNRMQVNAAGVGLGAFIALALVAFLEIKDSSFRNDADVFNVLALPVLAQVPYLETDDDRSRVRRRRLMFAAAAITFCCVGGYVFWAMQLWKHVI